MGDEPTPTRRVSDHGDTGVWGAIDGLRYDLRVFAPIGGMVAHQAAEIDALKESLGKHEQLVREGFERAEADAKERFDRAFAKLDKLDELAKVTNGRITELEAENIRQRERALIAAQTVEERRKTLALQVAQHGWVRPSITAAVVSFLVLAAGKLL